MSDEITYSKAGVDVEAGDKAVELMRSAVSSTHTPHVWGNFGGFAGLYDVSELANYRAPLLATSTDGVGTKVALAQKLDIHDTIGYDLVGMVVDDIVVVGAKPLFMTDYIACGKVVPERIADIVRGIAEACQETGTALIGGETAEHPGLLGIDEYDVAGAVTGVVEKDQLLGADRVKAGDVVIALASSGLHSNGFSLVRNIIEANKWNLEDSVPEFNKTLGEELLTPTRLYAQPVLHVVSALEGNVHAMSHVTGGGLAANVARVLPQGTHVTLDRSTWSVPTVFSYLGQAGNVPQDDMERTWNLGVGMVLIVAHNAVDQALEELKKQGQSAWVMGEITSSVDNTDGVVQGAKGVDGGSVKLVGQYL
ncbi:MAG: phosphoribosylformylglycinamidine cyclo-ligase [Micrococcaceae bacterium]